MGTVVGHRTVSSHRPSVPVEHVYQVTGQLGTGAVDRVVQGCVPEAVSRITRGRGQRGPEAVGRVAQARLRPCSARRLLAVDGGRQRRSTRYGLGRRWSTAWAHEERACCPLPVPVATNSVTASSTGGSRARPCRPKALARLVAVDVHLAHAGQDKNDPAEWQQNGPDLAD